MTEGSGPHGGARLGLVAALGALAMIAVPSAARAAGGTYNVLQCHDYSRWGGAALPGNNGGYRVADHCTGTDARYDIRATGHSGPGWQGNFTFTAPPGTNISAFSLAFDGRTADGHYSEVAITESGGELMVWRASNQPGGYLNLGPYYPLHASQIVIRLKCEKAEGCGASTNAHAWARNVAIELRDIADPSIAGVGGSMLSGGWLRGNQGLSASSGDFGSGIVSLQAFVNGNSAYHAIASAGVLCGGETPPFTARLIPCRGTPNFSISPNTARWPFRNGDNEVVLRASDYAGNVTVAPYTVKIDNAQPSVAFSNARDPNDPELIRALISDQHSGVAGASIFYRAVGTPTWEPLETKVEAGIAQARVDSLKVPSGEYEFLATASDLAGNGTLSTKREDGTAMKLAFPLKSAVELRAHLNRGGSKGQVVRYGTDAKAKGMLLDASGNPLANQQVTIVEHFGAGALIRERVSQATTDEKGKWRSKVPGGPSRDVEASFGGTGRYAPAGRGVGTLAVRSRASFETSRKYVPEGKAVTFKGKVRHFGARIPSGGKLVELQVRMKTGRWDTIGEAFRTNENGTYRRSYRFGNHYTGDALFHFRVKVKRESKWPYKRTATHQRKVIVRAH